MMLVMGSLQSKAEDYPYLARVGEDGVCGIFDADRRGRTACCHQCCRDAAFHFDGTE